MFLLIINLHTLNISEDTCPMTLKIRADEEIDVKVPADFPVSFANWVGDLNIEIESFGEMKKIYGPYSNKRKVFGIYFRESSSIIKLTSEKVITKIVLGCLDYNDINNSMDGLNNPGGWAYPVGSYSRNFSETDYPVLFTDDSGLSIYFFFGVLGYTIFMIVFTCCCLVFKCKCCGENSEYGRELARSPFGDAGGITIGQTVIL